MKLAIISEYNYLTTTGGTENYTAMLAEALCKRGYELIFISRGNQKNGITQQDVSFNEYSYKIFLLPADQYNVSEIRQEIISRTWSPILSRLQIFMPDIVHVHTLSPFFNIRHIEACKRYFKDIIFTSHVPGHFCMKGNLIQNNRKPCDGLIGWKCNICLMATDLRQGFSSVINGHTQKKKEVLKTMDSLGITIVCPSRWQMLHLLQNGYPAEKLNIIRQALIYNSLQAVERKSNHTASLRIGYLGRLTPEKGSTLLLSILKHYKKSSTIQFVLGIPANSDPGEMQKLHAILATPDVNITLNQHITSLTKAAFFDSIDLLFIPSFFIETGPIVLLEAIFYGKKVLAPDIGGPSEFAAEYPDFVTCYKWNDQDDIVHQLQQFHQTPIVSDFKYTQQFQNKQNEFIEKHIQLYTQHLIKEK
jgi:glycosyltransferase involved in cell wall biosynthesis